MERFTAGTTVLDRAEATELLRRKDVGRIVIALGGEAEIFPVNYVLGEGCNVLFRTGPGSKLASAVVATRAKRPASPNTSRDRTAPP